MHSGVQNEWYVWYFTRKSKLKLYFSGMCSILMEKRNLVLLSGSQFCTYDIKDIKAY